MFKKAIDVRVHQRLSKADRKKLRRTIQDKLPSASDEVLDLILPPKADIKLSKLANRAWLFTIEGGQPVFIDRDGKRQEICPTVYALWMVPHLYPSFLTKGWQVSKYVLSGADLMLPGVEIPVDGLPPFSAGKVWSVRVPGNAYPFAVGVTPMSQQEAINAGFRGKLLRIVHYYRDTLWEAATGSFTPNEGFKEDCVMPDPNPPSSDVEADVGSKADESTLEGDSGAPSSDGREDSGGAEATKRATSPAGDEASGSVGSSSGPGSTNENDLEQQQEDDFEWPEGWDGTSQFKIPADVDAMLDRCLLQALCTSVRPRDFPLGASALWLNHVLPCRPPGVTIDIKKSSYKKLSKWLQAKAADGLINGKEDKYSKEFILQSFNYRHDAILSFIPEKKTPPPAAAAAKSTVSCASECQGQLAGTARAAGAGSSSAAEVTEFYKPTHHVADIFQSVGVDQGRCFSASEAREVVFAYINQQALTEPSDPSVVVMDAIRCDALFRGTVEKGKRYPTDVYKRDVGPAFLARMQSHHSVTRGGKTVVHKGELQPVKMVTEGRQGNKKVTRVTGLEGFLIEAEPLAAELQKKFAASTTVNDMPGKKGHYEVLVQGVMDDFARLLVDSYGVPKQYIEVLDQTRR